MNTDSHYEIGHTHLKCDDYAISGTIDNVGYAVVSDGCTGSASNHTDVGSRLLCLIVRDIILHLSRMGYFKGPEFRASVATDAIYDTFKTLLLRKIAEVRVMMNLSSDTFDATLLIALAITDSRSGYTHSMFLGWGDGTFIVKYSDGVTRINTIEYNPNQPYYPSYAVSPSKHLLYMDSMKNGKVTYNEMLDGIPEDDPRYGLRYWKDSDDDMFLGSGFRRNVETTIPDKFDEHYKVSQLIVCTDGISTFQYDPKSDEYQQNPTVFPIREVYPEVTGFKVLNGPFVQRRISRMALMNSRKRIVHMDDLAVAAISLE